MAEIDNEMSGKRVQRAYLVACYGRKDEMSGCQEHLEELKLLAETYGVDVIGTNACLLKKITASTYFTKGKLEELIQEAHQLKADLVIFDEEITPAQQRNLEEAFGILVIDRTEVIIGVFAQRAQTNEARLQIELAKAQYEAPRLKRLWTHLSRQAGTSGGGKYLKGEGEKQIEIDRRLLKKRITMLKRELEQVRDVRQTQRSLRQKTRIPTFALIGYTNAGKSTLLNALTDAGVFVEDKLFATLDTTTRKFMLPNNQEVLLIDTVGFIRKLPHLLIEAFMSTLEEALEADILLHLIDASNPTAVEQAKTSHNVLKELGASDKPIIHLLNKCDLPESHAIIPQLRANYLKTIPVSALQKTGFEDLIEIMIDALKDLRQVCKFIIPQKEYALVSEIRREGRVLYEEYEHNDVIIRAEVPAFLVSKYSSYIEGAASP